jgi:hypothetical protein
MVIRRVLKSCSKARAIGRRMRAHNWLNLLRRHRRRRQPRPPHRPDHLCQRRSSSCTRLLVGVAQASRAVARGQHPLTATLPPDKLLPKSMRRALSSRPDDEAAPPWPRPSTCITLAACWSARTASRVGLAARYGLWPAWPAPGPGLAGRPVGAGPRSRRGPHPPAGGSRTAPPPATARTRSAHPGPLGP